MTTFYKVLNEDGTPCNGGSGKWHLPSRNRPGRWMPEIANVEPCVRGYHLCDSDHLLDWLSGPAVYVAEGRGTRVDHGDKVVFSEARLAERVWSINERTLRLFACLCAERAVPCFEARHPNDSRPRQAIEVARRFADGQATRDELAGAADAAYAAARASAADAAYAAYAAAYSAYAAAYSAYAAARASADAERDWQNARLAELIAADSVDWMPQ